MIPKKSLLVNKTQSLMIVFRVVTRLEPDPTVTTSSSLSEEVAGNTQESEIECDQADTARTSSSLSDQEIAKQGGVWFQIFSQCSLHYYS